MKKHLTLFLSVIATSLFSQPVIEWQRLFGGEGNEEAYHIQPTADGGYIIAGTSTSENSGDVGDNKGGSDCWIVKLDAAGDMEWQRTLGGSKNEGAVYIHQTSDGGYIMGAQANSDDGDVTGHHNNTDMWVVKLDETGAIEWQRSLGGTADDRITSIVSTTDGGSFVCGQTSSVNGDVTGNHGNRDIWVVKLDSLGAIQWQKTFGGSWLEAADEAIQTADGGYAIVGYTTSIDGDLLFSYGEEDIWVIKLTASGDIEWSNTFGGNIQDLGSTIRQTADGGYIVGGGTNSTNGHISSNQGQMDMWVFKLTPEGELEWERTLGGTSIELVTGLELTADGGYILTAGTYSNNGHISVNYGLVDGWVARLDASGEIIWEKSFGGSQNDEILNILPTADGGFIFIGMTNSNDGDVTGNHGGYDVWVVKLSSGITGVEDAPGATPPPLTIFPNPASNLLRIAIDREALPETAIFADLSGKILSTKTIATDGHIEVAELPAGVYLLTVTDSNGVRYLGKVVKQ